MGRLTLLRSLALSEGVPAALGVFNSAATAPLEGVLGKVRLLKSSQRIDYGSRKKYVLRSTGGGHYSAKRKLVPLTIRTRRSRTQETCFGRRPDSR